MVAMDKAPTLPRRILNVFYVLDTSGSMRGLAIQRLNRAMKESLMALQSVAHSNGNAELRIAVLQYNSNWRWMQPAGPERVEDFLWDDMVAAGETNIGAALDELNAQLSMHRFLKSSTGALMPVIIFMTDGCASDNYRAALRRIEENPYFTGATRVGFAIGDFADVEMISALVGGTEAVIRTADLDLFANLIRFVSANASSRASVSRRPGEGAIGPSVVNDAINQVGAVRDPNGGTVVLLEDGMRPVVQNKHGKLWEIPEL